MNEFYNYTQIELELILDSFTKSVEKLPNVNGTGIRIKEKDGKELDYICLTAYVSKKHPATDLRPNELIPKFYEYESRKYPTDVQEIGEVSIQKDKY